MPHDHVWNSAKEIVAAAHLIALSEIDGLRRLIVSGRPRTSIADFGYEVAMVTLDGLASILAKLNPRVEYDVERLDLKCYCEQASAALIPLVDAFSAATEEGFPAARAALMDWLQQTRIDLSTKATAFDDASETLPVP